MSIFLRVADISDASLILEWRNDPTTRDNSFSKDVIDMNTHMNWLQNKLTDTNCFIYILMNDSEPIGQLRIDKTDNIGEISYTIVPDKRGLGYGKKL